MLQIAQDTGEGVAIMAARKEKKGKAHAVNVLSGRLASPHGAPDLRAFQQALRAKIQPEELLNALAPGGEWWQRHSVPAQTHHLRDAGAWLQAHWQAAPFDLAEQLLTVLGEGRRQRLHLILDAESCGAPLKDTALCLHIQEAAHTYRLRVRVTFVGEPSPTSKACLEQLATLVTLRVDQVAPVRHGSRSRTRTRPSSANANASSAHLPGGPHTIARPQSAYRGMNRSASAHQASTPPRPQSATRGKDQGPMTGATWRKLSVRIASLDRELLPTVKTKRWLRQRSLKALGLTLFQVATCDCVFRGFAMDGSTLALEHAQRYIKVRSGDEVVYVEPHSINIRAYRACLRRLYQVYLARLEAVAMAFASNAERQARLLDLARAMNEPDMALMLAELEQVKSIEDQLSRLYTGNSARPTEAVSGMSSVASSASDADDLDTEGHTPSMVDPRHEDWQLSSSLVHAVNLRAHEPSLVVSQYSDEHLHVTGTHFEAEQAVIAEHPLTGRLLSAVVDNGPPKSANTGTAISVALIFDGDHHVYQVSPAKVVVAMVARSLSINDACLIPRPDTAHEYLLARVLEIHEAGLNNTQIGCQAMDGHIYWHPLDEVAPMTAEQHDALLHSLQARVQARLEGLLTQAQQDSAWEAGQHTDTEPDCTLPLRLPPHESPTTPILNANVQRELRTRSTSMGKDATLDTDGDIGSNGFLDRSIVATTQTSNAWLDNSTQTERDPFDSSSAVPIGASSKTDAAISAGTLAWSEPGPRSFINTELEATHTGFEATNPSPHGAAPTLSPQPSELLSPGLASQSIQHTHVARAWQVQPTVQSSTRSERESTQQRTLGILLPPVLENGVEGEVLAEAEQAGLNIVYVQRVCVSRSQVEALYMDLHDATTRQHLTEVFHGGAALVVVLEGPGAIPTWRQLCGLGDGLEDAHTLLYAAPSRLHYQHALDTLLGFEYQPFGAAGPREWRVVHATVQDVQHLAMSEPYLGQDVFYRHSLDGLFHRAVLSSYLGSGVFVGHAPAQYGSTRQILLANETFFLCSAMEQRPCRTGDKVLATHPMISDTWIPARVEADVDAAGTLLVIYPDETASYLRDVEARVLPNQDEAMFAELWKTAMQARLRYCARDVVCLDPHSGYFYPAIVTATDDLFEFAVALAGTVPNQTTSASHILVRAADAVLREGDCVAAPVADKDGELEDASQDASATDVLAPAKVRCWHNLVVRQREFPGSWYDGGILT
ncbi:uncharacterized protein MONBRDRAFT_28652 [Monosiga brevicollis MX1]|uniref:Nucleoside diphosphate kinase-like domain-containing protein n=1 Tax=Monosiga brevicollis TaxID=81824 RepID=A9V8S8_MONBE|nr:uncharacterized protein MONBRDRAFT_28652 [Monosiga brevicollis MX1]EDQ86013.1 predicted protein [Monosiga brevicollis MX1]|eukprot:XP_001749207.1 hypothetical protein [Monosiga brevicollis MX1]